MLSHYLVKFGGHKHCDIGDIMVLVRHAIKLSHHPAKFGGHSHCGSGDIMVLVCHVIPQDHVMKGSCDFIVGSPSW